MRGIGSLLCTTVHRALHATIITALGRYAAPAGALLDVGCWDGGHTVDYGEACQAIRLFGGRAAHRLAERLARDPDPGVRAAAAAVLK